MPSPFFSFLTHILNNQKRKFMQVKSKNVNSQNTTLNMPIDGEVEVVNGIAEVSDELGNLLLGNPADWELVEGEIEELDEEDEDKGGDDKTADDGLDKLELADLVEMAKGANLKGYNLFAKDAAKMRAFLRKKLNAGK